MLSGTPTAQLVVTEIDERDVDGSFKEAVRCAGHEDLSAMGRVHHSCGLVHRQSDVRPAGARDPHRAAVHTHPQLQLGIFFQLFADLHRTPHRRFRAVKEYEGHSIARGKSN